MLLHEDVLVAFRRYGFTYEQPRDARFILAIEKILNLSL